MRSSWVKPVCVKGKSHSHEDFNESIENNDRIQVNSENTENVGSLIYLGSIFTIDDDDPKEIKTRFN